MSAAPFAMETHIGAALRSGDISVEEMREFVVHFAVYAGHPKATAVRAALDAAAAQAPQA
jgi:4-carboxymuconolactone decarboxylase